MLAIAAQLAISQPVFAQENQTVAPVQVAPRDEGDIIVAAPPAEEALRAFVGEVSARSSNRQLARWDRSICPGVIGMNAPHAQFMIDRIAATAVQLGLTVGEAGCRANILIFMTYEADAMAQQIADHPRLSSNRGRHGNTRGREALRDFAATPRPVRWWHVSQTVTRDGFVVRRGEQVTVREMGRARSSVRQDFDRALIVIDANRVNGVRLDALSDYVTMAALAQLDPEADVSTAPTILALFSDEPTVQPAPAAITTWDMAYLQGLYGAVRNARNSDQQEEEIARRMAGEHRQ